MRLRTEAGEAVMLVIMGAMIVSGLVVWLAAGDFHMMGMHGGKHTKEESVSPAPHEAQKGHAASRPEDRLKADEEQNSKGK